MWITRLSIAQPVFATMVMAALCVLGLFSYFKLGVEQLPDISPPVAAVTIAYPGASPAAVETEVTRPLELALNTIAGVKMIRSNSFEGRSETAVEFNLDADMARAMQELRDRVAVVQSVLPRDARTPRINRAEMDNAQPTAVYALQAPDRGTRELSVLADQVVTKRFERSEGVGRVEVTGVTARLVRVELDPVRLRTYAVTPAEIAEALRRANADLPVGLVSDAQRDAIVRVEGRVADPRAFAEVIVAKRGALAVRLADVATIVEREKERDSLARINGQPALTFSVFRQQDANVVTTGEAVKLAAADLKSQLPPGVTLTLIWASSDWVANSLNGVKRTLIEGALLTVAIVFLFLKSWRSTVITGLTLPISVIASFIAVYAFGFTLNFMTMMALSLCIGLLIDDAIVVRENIVRHIALGADHRTASLEGTREIGIAVMATTFALCAVFVPIAFMSGIVGKFFFPFGITVAMAVLVSLFVSFTLDPMLSSVWKDPPMPDGRHRAERWPVIGPLMRATDRFMDALHRAYAHLIHWIFVRRHRNRLVVLGIGAASLVGALAITPLVGSEFVPETDQGFTSLNVRMPVGTSLERADAKLRQVEAIVSAQPEVRTVSVNVGQPSRSQASVTIGLVPRRERARSQKQVEEVLRRELARIPGIELSVGWNRPIYVALLGNDPVLLDRETEALAAKIRAVPGVVDLETSVKPGLPAFAVRLRPEAAAELGLTPPQLAASLRAYINGEVATTWTAPDGQVVDVELRLPQDDRRNVAQLARLPVAFGRDGTAIPLEAVATVTEVVNPDVIKRQNLQRRQGIYAGVEGRASGDVGDDVQQVVKAHALPPGVSIDVGGAQRDQQEAFKAMVAALGLSVIFIYIVLASQFASFLQPIAIMASLPLALIGVMLALLVTGSTLNLFSMIGLVMLMGLVTKNAILLVDRANQRLRDGLSMAEALLDAGQVRMRPIMMTTAAMVFGMLPLALALNEGGELQASMGRAIIGGVITSTVLTLVVVPVVWSYLVRPAGLNSAASASSHGDALAPIRTR
jgi:hydrophobe/amphiphile efflux-1 (HAE1) family protein